MVYDLKEWLLQLLSIEIGKLLDAGRIHKIELNAWTVCCENHNKKTAIFEKDECGT